MQPAVTWNTLTLLGIVDVRLNSVFPKFDFALDSVAISLVPVNLEGSLSVVVLVNIAVVLVEKFIKNIEDGIMVELFSVTG
jgi:hypothetical protein